MNEYHVSVLLQEVIENLGIESGGKYIDATLGGGGHTREILKKGVSVLGIDQDDDAIAHAHETLKEWGNAITIVKANFRNIDQVAKDCRFESVSGILFDLGVSSFQLETPQRGFSFLKDAPLDMRMDSTQPVTAGDLVNGLHKGELIELFTKLGEEPFAKKIALAIITSREKRKIETTRELASIIEKTVHKYEKGIHPATRVFQALRMAVNDELGSLRDVLPKACSLLKTSGRLVVISFHSLEDRIVKNTFLEFEAQRLGTILSKKPITPSQEEIRGNPRSRSAKLRVFKKI